MTAHSKRQSHFNLFSLIWFRFVALWHVLAFIVGLVGRVLAIVLGLVLMVAGVLVSLTIIGAILGIPLLIVGFMLVLRGIF